MESMYQDLTSGLDERPSATVIPSRRGHIEETYQHLVEALALAVP
ncbi:hypothetical protein [Arthrobacter sp. YN]|nr:hypothetical protein [Arthrobacter sp. YN]